MDLTGSELQWVNIKRAVGGKSYLYTNKAGDASGRCRLSFGGDLWSIHHRLSLPTSQGRVSTCFSGIARSSDIQAGLRKGESSSLFPPLSLSLFFGSLGGKYCINFDLEKKRSMGKRGIGWFIVIIDCIATLLFFIVFTYRILIYECVYPGMYQSKGSKIELVMYVVDRVQGR